VGVERDELYRLTEKAEKTSILKREEEEKEEVSNRSSLCTYFGKLFPRMEIVFICQMVAIHAVIAVSLFNLTRVKDDDKLWIALLSSCLGCILPNPKVEPRS
jgi:hypothetical protein